VNLRVEGHAGHRYFKLEGDDRGVYIVRYDEAAAEWELTMFERSGSD